MRQLLLFVFVISCFPAFAQEYEWKKSDEKLAVQFYQNGEFEKARPLFEELLKDGNDHLSDYYFDCLLKLSDFREAEKFMKKRIKKSDSKLVMQVDLAYVYFLDNNLDKQEKEIKDIIDNLPANEITIQAVAGAFERRDFSEAAFESYLQGRTRLNNEYAFAKSLAELYGQKGEIENMVSEYIKFLKVSPTGVDVVKSAFAGEIDDDTKYEIIKNSLIKEIQQNPDYSQLVDVLSWTFVSKREFLAAYIQLKGLDKRLNESGRRLIELAEVCRDNKAFTTAEKCYDYVLSLGNRLPYFYQAKLGLIDTKYQRIKTEANPSVESLELVEKDFYFFSNEQAIPMNERWKAYLRLAEIRAVYLGKYQKAIEGLEEVENSPRVASTVRGRIKIDLGNYYLLSGDIWEASLKYSQVEKMFKDHPLGHEAKFMNAKLSFYRGDFEWAKAQLDVLKGSTSELIANDALQLSMLIQDNLALDTITTPLELYATADKYIFMKRYDDAILVLDTINQFFPGHSLRDEILMAKGKIYYQRGEYDTALVSLADVYTNHSYDILADDALYLAATILQDKLGREEDALKLLDMLIFQHQDSIYGVDAKKRYQLLIEKYPDRAEKFFNGLD